MRQVKAIEVQARDEIFIKAAGCSSQLVGVAETSAAMRRGYAEFKIKSGISSWTRRHFPDTKILVNRP